MNFFKFVFSDDPDPPRSESDNSHRRESPDSPGPDSSPTEHRHDPSGGWNFGGLIKSLGEKSESIIDIYRRDLQEFGIGLKKEIEVAHGSLETVGHVIDQFGNTVIKGTAQIISQGRDAILESDPHNKKMKKQGSMKCLNSKRYSRFDAQVRAVQGDPSTYTEVPGDLERYNKWKSEFSLDGKSEEMEGFLRENDAMESVYKRVVPNTVDSETFWYRYYYKVYKLKKAEDVRARLVGRMSREEEELSWDVEDEDEEVRRGGGYEIQDGDGSKEIIDQVDSAKDFAADSDKKMVKERNVAGDGKSLPVASQQSKHEEEIEWEEIDDLGSVDEKKATRSGSPNNVDLRKRLNAAAEEKEEDGDLSWDIEDDDEEPAKC